jgi:hypothetical protein
MSLSSAYARISLLTILSLTLHFTDDVLRKSSGLEQPGFSGLVVVLILVAWLYSILRLEGRRVGYIIGLLGSFMASFIALGHLTGVGGDTFITEIADSTGAFFVWAVFALGVTGLTALIFSAMLLFNPTAAKSAAQPG